MKQRRRTHGWAPYIEGRDPKRDEIVWRRFGRDHEQPCNDPSMLTCANPECQYLGACRLPAAPVSDPAVHSEGTDMTDHSELFQPDWRLPPQDALAVHIRIALQRRGIDWKGKLDTDERWSRIGLEIINGLMRDTISPCKIVELPRAWDAASGRAALDKGER